VGLKAENSLYADDVATYSDNDAFDHEAAKGFITIWGLTVKTWKSVHSEGIMETPELKVVGAEK
jgi:argininosuccinate synthase